MRKRNISREKNGHRYDSELEEIFYNNLLGAGVFYLSSVLLGVAFLITPTPSIWFIYFILLLRGIGGTFHMPAMQAAIPMLVPPEVLPKAGGWSNLIPMLLFNIIFMPLGSLYPLLVRTHFGGGAWHNGATEFVFAGGMLLASFIMGVWGGMKRRFLMVSIFTAVLGLASAVSGILPSSAFVPFLICCFFMGITGPFINIPLMVYVQQTTAPEVMGKVLSLIMTATTLTMPFGLLLAGPTSEFIGVTTWFFYSGVAMLATGLLCWRMTRRYDREAPDFQQG